MMTPPLRRLRVQCAHTADKSIVSFPGGVSGSFENMNDQDNFRFTAEMGERVRVRAMRRSLSSHCDVSVKLLKPYGKTLAASNDDESAEGVI